MRVIKSDLWFGSFLFVVYFQGVDLFTEVMILSAPDKQLKDQENRINKLDLEGELVHLYINVFLGSAWQKLLWISSGRLRCIINIISV